MKFKQFVIVDSAKEALRQSHALSSCWSEESILTQRILIYIAELFERQTKHRKPRKPSAYSLFVSKQMRNGKTMREAAKAWKATKGTPNDKSTN